MVQGAKAHHKFPNVLADLPPPPPPPGLTTPHQALGLHFPPLPLWQGLYLLQLLLSLQNIPLHLVSIGLHARNEQSQFLGCSPGWIVGSRGQQLWKGPPCLPRRTHFPDPLTPAFYREESMV